MSNIKNYDTILNEICEFLTETMPKQDITLEYNDINNIWQLDANDFNQIISDAVKKLNLHVCHYKQYKFIVPDKSYSIAEVTAVDTINNTITVAES